MAKQKTAEQTATTNETIIAPIIAPIEATKAIPNSERLSELKATKKQHLVAARSFEPDSDGEAAELLEAYKTEQLIKAEIANIVNAEKLAEQQLQRSKIIDLNNNQLAAYKAMIEAHEADDILGYAVLVDTFKAANDIVNNALLASKLLTPKTSLVASNGTKQSETENLAMHVANVAAGMTDSQSRKSLELAGVPRSTAWHTVSNYNKANGK